MAEEKGYFKSSSASCADRDEDSCRIGEISLLNELITSGFMKEGDNLSKKVLNLMFFCNSSLLSELKLY